MITDATFAALMRLLDSPAFVAVAVVVIVLVLVIAWEFFLRGMEKWRVIDLRTVNPPVPETQQCAADSDYDWIDDTKPSVRRVRAGM